MRPVSELKQDFEVAQSLGDIIDVLKTAAMIQFRSFQSKIKPDAEFLKELKDSFKVMASKNLTHPFLFERKSLPSQIVIVTSDEGFLGELNTVLVNNGVDKKTRENDEIIVMGERGARYLEDMGLKFSFLPGIADEIEIKDIEALKDHLIGGYKKKFGRIIMVYSEFQSLTNQKVKALQILPYDFSILTGEKVVKKASDEAMLMEPAPKKVLEALVELWFGYQLLEIFWSSKQSEFAARIMHLEGSTQELSHLRQKLSFEYFRQVHTLRDKVIREISASKIMLGKRM